jgi:hypothetical protein
MLHAIRIRTAESKYLQLAEFVLTSCYRRNLRRSNIQTYYNGLFGCS